MNLPVTLDETPEPTVKRPKSGCKSHKREINARPGRLYFADKNYGKTRTHTGKGTTLRSHRKV